MVFKRLPVPRAGALQQDAEACGMQAVGLKALAFGYGLAFYMRRRDAFPTAYLDQLAERIVASPYLAANNLNYRFSGTRGYSLIFRRDGMPRVRTEFEEFADYLDAVDDGVCNAFFLNPLVIGHPPEGQKGVRVAPHVDRSLRSVTLPVEPPNPRRVSVLYVQVPEGMRGGDLRLYHNLLPIARIRPRRNVLLVFQGWLRHEVTAAFLPPESRPRISLVCEQYVLDEELLARVPSFTVRSKSPFDNFLEVELERDNAEDPPPDSTAERAPE